jgi:hypothetical protein
VFLRAQASRVAVTTEKVQRTLAANKSVGKLLYDITYWDYDIETEQHGAVDTHLVFELPQERELVLIGSGDFWSEYTYKHPVSGQPFSPSDFELADMEEALKEDLELLDSAVEFQMTLEGQIDQN